MSTTYNGTIFEEISVDVSQPNEFAPRLVKQGDAYTRGYIITLTENGEKLTIPTANTTAWFNCRNKTDPTKRASAAGTINGDGTVTVLVPTVVMEVEGFIQCDISIITASGSNTNILKSTLFYLNCEESANPNGTTTAAEDSILAGIAAGTIVPPAGPYVPKTRQIAGINLTNDINAISLLRAIHAPYTVWSNNAPTAGDTGVIGDEWAHCYTEDDVAKFDMYFCTGATGGQYGWQKQAAADDIPSVISALENDCGYIPVYNASSAPPTSQVENIYAVPCLWVYHMQLWIVWGRTPITIPGQPTRYVYTYQKLETLETSSDVSPKFNGQICILGAATNKLRYGYGNDWYVLANESYVDQYSLHTMSYTLQSSSWSGLTQQLNISSSYTATGNTKVDMEIDDTAYTALLTAGCKGLYVVNNGGSLVVHALGAAPTTNVTVQLTITEVMNL